VLGFRLEDGASVAAGTTSSSSSSNSSDDDGAAVFFSRTDYTVSAGLWGKLARLLRYALLFLARPLWRVVSTLALPVVLLAARAPRCSCFLLDLSRCPLCFNPSPTLTHPPPIGAGPQQPHAFRALELHLQRRGATRRPLEPASKRSEPRRGGA
jgi:hypothetical protein